MKQKIFITGGHFTPAKAVVSVLLKSQTWEIFYVGRKHALEGDRALSLEYLEMHQQKGVTFLELTAGKIPRTLTAQAIWSIIKIPVGLVQSLAYLLYYRPSIIMSFGGYIAVPMVLIGRLLGIKIAHHEQVAVFDIPSRLLAKLSNRVMVSFPSLIPPIDSAKWCYTGNPVRDEVFQVNPAPELEMLTRVKKHQNLKAIYITGGNQGSHVINTVVLSLLPRLLSRFVVIWQTGDSQQFRDYDVALGQIRNLPQEQQERIVLQKFILGHSIGAVFALADLVVGRSGANTVFELAALAKPAILIPIPWVHDQEQLANAQLLTSRGGAVVLPQTHLSDGELWSSIETVFNRYDDYHSGALLACQSLPKNPALQIVTILRELVS